ncbi:MAG: ADP-ribosylation factor-like protein [Candidatus Hodarchaeota archaeon]
MPNTRPQTGKTSRIARIYEKIRSKFKSFVVRAPREMRILLLGLDYAGKTTLVNQLKLKEGKEVETEVFPTMGVNVETISLRNLRLQILDIGGQFAFRETLWKSFLLDSAPDLLVYVVDSAESDHRMKIAKDAFWSVASFLEGKENIDIVVFANKQDLEHARPVGEVAHELDLTRAIRSGARSFSVYPISCLTGEGLEVAFDFIYEKLSTLVS